MRTTHRMEIDIAQCGYMAYPVTILLGLHTTLLVTKAHISRRVGLASVSTWNARTRIFTLDVVTLSRCRIPATWNLRAVPTLSLPCSRGCIRNMSLNLGLHFLFLEVIAVGL